ncbi:hypothetical protein [Fluviicola taffensis]|uniref:Uncharacterized protein n=1 Tax=Fluviicola taffensis (strain DSM 16823 / NCIMB 13979 / RW262) TaxID=755732 RepID=F2IG92_FLUTR|nr:hypothetical protein [Fluviicola taffensis]AEA45758.1 hypothetical protein Fluta_3791 [Fluviicola taffensis DSM 16823]
MAKIYNVTIKRACSANNSQMSVDVTIDEDVKIPIKKDDKTIFFKSTVLSQHPEISKPCKLGEFDVLYISEKGSTSGNDKNSTSAKPKSNEKKSRPIWLSLILFPFKLIGWLFKNLIWKQIK